MATRYGIYLPLFDPFGHPRVIADLARDAEAAGWDGVFTWDDVAGWEQEMADPTVALAVINGLWQGEPFAFEGEHYHLKPAVFRPRPVQQRASRFEWREPGRTSAP